MERPLWQRSQRTWMSAICIQCKQKWDEQGAQGPQVRAEGWLPIKNTVFKTWRFARLHSSCCKTTPAIRSRAGVLRGAWHSEDWGWRAQRRLEQEVSKEIWKLLVTYLWEIWKEKMAGTGCQQAAKENRQRESSQPQLIQMPGLRSPVTSSASRETEAQKEGFWRWKQGWGGGGPSNGKPVFTLWGQASGHISAAGSGASQGLALRMEGLKTSGSVYFDQSLPPPLLLPAAPASPRALLTPAASGRPYTCSGLTQWGHHPGTGRMVGVMHSLWLAGADCTCVSAAAWSPSPGTFLHHPISAWAQAEPVCGCKSIVGQSTICSSVHGLEGRYAKWNKSDGERQILHHITYCGLKIQPISEYNKKEVVSQIQRTS